MLCFSCIASYIYLKTAWHKKYFVKIWFKRQYHQDFDQWFSPRPIIYVLKYFLISFWICKDISECLDTGWCGIVQDHDPALCSIAQDPGPAICGLVQHFLHRMCVKILNYAAKCGDMILRNVAKCRTMILCYAA
jgi:hypothetical protein